MHFERLEMIEQCRMPSGKCQHSVSGRHMDTSRFPEGIRNIDGKKNNRRFSEGSRRFLFLSDLLDKPV